MSSPIAIYYASHDGQTRRIATRIAARIGERGRETRLTDLGERTPTRAEIEAAGGVVIAAAIRYGHHLTEADALVTACRDLFTARPPAVVSVSLTARKPNKRTAETNIYLRKWLHRHDLRPIVAAAVAGRLDYPSYRPLDRLMIRLIMKITGGPTDPTARIEYTDWDAVDALADRIAENFPEQD